MILDDIESTFCVDCARGLWKPFAVPCTKDDASKGWHPVAQQGDVFVVNAGIRYVNAGSAETNAARHIRTCTIRARN